MAALSQPLWSQSYVHMRWPQQRKKASTNCPRHAIDTGMGLVMPSASAPSSLISPQKAASGIVSSAIAVFDETEASTGTFGGYGS